MTPESRVSNVLHRDPGAGVPVVYRRSIGAVGHPDGSPRTAAGNRSAAIEEAIRQGGNGDAKDFQHRYWETSLAVIHLAAAWVAMMIKEKGSRDLFRMVTDAGFRVELVQQAMRLEDLVVRSDLRIPSDVLIRF
ncbi:MAG: hypothetical protein ACXVY3_05785, partial [Gaiellaceae bacterium]